MYRKEGRSIRLEIESGTTHTLDLRERGEAVEREGIFACTTLAGEPTVERAELPPIPDELVDAVMTMGESLERATLITGAASHTFHSGAGDRRWRDHVARIHLSLVNRHHALRCEIDRSDRLFTGHLLTELRELQQTLSSCRPGLEVSGAVTLEPAVSAAILAHAFARNLLPGIPAAQTPRPGEIDGKGNRVAARPLPLDAGDMPWFRPSYRTPPHRIPHGIDLVTDRTVSGSPSWRAIALTGDPAHDAGVLRARCLLTRDEDATVATIEIDQWSEEIEVVSEPEQWFPMLAGVWGRRLIFRGNVSRTTAD